jgi:hypothetical protein
MMTSAGDVALEEITTLEEADSDITVASISLLLLAHLKEQPRCPFNDLLDLAKEHGGGALFLPSLNFLYLAGLIGYQPVTDTIEYTAIPRSKEETRKLLVSIEERIVSLRVERRWLCQKKKEISAMLENGQIDFNMDEAQNLFQQAGVLLGGEMKKDFCQLIAFDRAVTDERRVYLAKRLVDTEDDLERIGAHLELLTRKRTEIISEMQESIDS